MVYDQSQNVYRIPIKANPTCFDAGEVQIGADSLHKTIATIVRDIMENDKAEDATPPMPAEDFYAKVERAVNLRVPAITNLVEAHLVEKKGTLWFRDVVAATVRHVIQKPETEGHTALRLLIKQIAADATLPFIDARIEQRIADALQHRLRDLRDARLQCDVREYPRSGKAAAMLDEANARARAQTDSPTARKVQENPWRGSPADVHKALTHDIDLVYSHVSGDGPYNVSDVTALHALQRVKATLAVQATHPSVTGVEAPANQAQSTVPPSTDADGYSERFAFRMPPDWRGHIDQLARQQGVEAADIVRRFVLEGLNRQTQPTTTPPDASAGPPARTMADVAYEARRTSLITELQTALDKAQSLTAPWSGCHVIPKYYKYDAATDSYRRG